MLMMVNVDDVEGEAVPYVIERLIDIGAENVHAIPAITKKGRPGFIFFIDVVRDKVDAISEFLVREVGTLGLRLFQEDEHIQFNYEIRKARIVLPDIGVKLSLDVKIVRDSKGAVASVKAEHRNLREAVDVLSQAGAEVPLSDLKELVEAAVLRSEGREYRGLSVELDG